MPEKAITTDERILALATKRAIQAAGGLETCEREVAVSDTQLSRCCSPNQRDSITIRDAAVIDALGSAESGAPHILQALARVIGNFVVIRMPDAADETSVSAGVLELADELGDVSGAIRAAMRGDSLGGADMVAAEAAIAIEHLNHLDQASANLRHRLQRIANGNTEQPAEAGD